MNPASRQPKPLEWIGSSKKDLKALPEEVIDVFGYALHLAQIGGRHAQAKPLQGFGSASVLEVVEIRHRHPEAGHGFDPGSTESGHQARQGAER